LGKQELCVLVSFSFLAVLSFAWIIIVIAIPFDFGCNRLLHTSNTGVIMNS
jgi:hypothetical protein